MLSYIEFFIKFSTNVLNRRTYYFHNNHRIVQCTDAAIRSGCPNLRVPNFQSQIETTKFVVFIA